MRSGRGIGRSVAGEKFGGGEQVGKPVIRLDGVFAVASGVAGLDQDGTQASIGGGLEVGGGISDEPALGKIEVKFAGGPFDEAGLRLAAIAIDFEVFDFAGVAAVGMVRTGVDRVDVRAFAAQFHLQTIVDAGEFFKRALAAGDDGLVGDDDDAELGLAQEMDGPGRTGNQVEIFGAADVGDFFVERAVAVEEDGGPGVIETTSLHDPTFEVGGDPVEAFRGTGVLDVFGTGVAVEADALREKSREDVFAEVERGVGYIE